MLVFGVVTTVVFGYAEPYVSPPGDPVFVFGGVAVAVVAGVLVIAAVDRRIKRWSWRRAGAQANLTPEGGATRSGRPELTGTVDGRRVRARTRTRKRSGDAEAGPRTSTSTLVETDLDRPSEQGLVVALDGGTIESWKSSLPVDTEADLMARAGLAVVRDGDRTVVGHDEAVARAVATGRSGDALRSLDANLVYVGDAAGVVNRYLRSAVPEGTGLRDTVVRALARSEGEFDDSIPGDGSTVSVETATFVADGDRLRAWAEAVVEIAAAFEEATAGS